MMMKLFGDWCCGMEVDIHRCLLVTGILEDCGQAEIEETLNGVLCPLGPYLVLSKIFLREENAKVALIEMGECVSLRAVPREFPGRRGVWRVVCRDPTHDAEFLKNLNEFLEAEGRTWEDVVRLLQLNNCPRPQSQNPPAENWAEALGVLLGAVVQIFYMDAEIHSLEKARAQEAAESYVVVAAAAAAASGAGRKVEKEPGRAPEVDSALKMESPDSWNDAEDGDPPKPGVKTCSGRRKQKKNPKQGLGYWKKPRDYHCNSSASLEDLEADDGENREVSECTRSGRKPSVRLEEWALKKSVEKWAWKPLRQAPQDVEAKLPLSQTKMVVVRTPRGRRAGLWQRTPPS